MMLRHKSTLDTSSIEEVLQYSIKYFEDSDQAILHHLASWNLPAIVGSYTTAFYDSCYLSKRKWAETFLHQLGALNRIIFELSLSQRDAITLSYNRESIITRGWLVGLKSTPDGKPICSPTIYNCWYWRDAVHMAMIQRDERLLTLMQSISTKEMFSRISQYNAINPDLIDSDWHELYLQLLNSNNPIAASVCDDIIHKLETQPANFIKNVTSFKDTAQRLKMLSLPYLRCIAAFLSGDSIQFEIALTEALSQHKAFCELPFRKERQGSLIPNSNNPQLFVSIPLLAICSWAYDRGYRWLTVSDYIPQRLIERDFQYEQLDPK